MLSKLSRRRGLQLEALGSVLICTVMLADRFLCHKVAPCKHDRLYHIRQSAARRRANRIFVHANDLEEGIRVVKRHDEKNQN